MHRSHKSFTIFSFSKNINNSINRYLKNAVCIRSFNVNYSDTNQSCLSQNAIYGNTFKTRSQTPVNKRNPTCEMCFNSFLLSFPMKKEIMKLIYAGS